MNGRCSHSEAPHSTTAANPGNVTLKAEHNCISLPSVDPFRCLESPVTSLHKITGRIDHHTAPSLLIECMLSTWAQTCQGSHNLRPMGKWQSSPQSEAQSIPRGLTKFSSDPCGDSDSMCRKCHYSLPLCVYDLKIAPSRSICLLLYKSAKLVSLIQLCASSLVYL